MLPGKERGLEIRTNKERGKGAGKENPYVNENEGFGTAHGAWRKGHIPWRRGRRISRTCFMLRKQKLHIFNKICGLSILLILFKNQS